MKEFNLRFMKGLMVGLRASETNPRNSQALVQATGVFPSEEALISTPSLDPIDISSIDPPPEFPFPQVFELRDGSVIVCTEDAIYSYENEVLTLELGGLTPGLRWTVADFYGFLFMANGEQTVYRDGVTREFSSSDVWGMSSCNGVCNFNGQLIVAAPNVAGDTPGGDGDGGPLEMLSDLIMSDTLEMI